MYQNFLRGLEADAKYGEYPEPAPFRTLGDVIELERRRRECEARELEAVSSTQPTRHEAIPA